MISVSIILANIYIVLSVLGSVLWDLYILTDLLFQMTLLGLILSPFTDENGKQSHGEAKSLASDVTADGRWS